uniref:Uncharacterized protein n=1 Tax=Rhizophora mucronata TaxID=61149 RepID=A0A2P2N3U4_RHIMU
MLWTFPVSYPKNCLCSYRICRKSIS